MDYEQTQPLPNDRGGSRNDSLPMYRCPCGCEFELDPETGGSCDSCQRTVPGSVTRFPMSMTMTLSDAKRGAMIGPVDERTDEPDELIGCRLGHFEIIESIGQGGMGQVYRALDTSLQRYVAVKVIRGSIAGNENADTQATVEDQQRLMHEAVAQARLNHPNVVTIYYVGQVETTPFLAMELIDGVDASELMRQGQIPYETLCKIALRITSALDTASQLGIVHSDIKPQNLLILTDGTVKLSDFGMARLKDQDESTAVGGTPNYLAPELLKGGQPTIQSDMYALGVTLFEMTFGELPVKLSGSSMHDWSQIHETTAIKFPEPWPDHLPEKWQAVLLRLLKKDPAERFESYNELGVKLQGILPVNRPPARALARAIAWAIDALSIALLTLPFAIGIQFLANMTGFGSVGNLVMLPALICFTALECVWRQSVGRELVHVKIINQYSLKPTRRRMLARSLLRMQLLWLGAIGGTLGFIPYLNGTLTVAALAFLAAEVVYMLWKRRGEFLHDRLTRTLAVVGSDTH